MTTSVNTNPNESAQTRELETAYFANAFAGDVTMELNGYQLACLRRLADANDWLIGTRTTSGGRINKTFAAQLVDLGLAEAQSIGSGKTRYRINDAGHDALTAAA